LRQVWWAGTLVVVGVVVGVGGVTLWQAPGGSELPRQTVERTTKSRPRAPIRHTERSALPSGLDEHPILAAQLGPTGDKLAENEGMVDEPDGNAERAEQRPIDPGQVEANARREFLDGVFQAEGTDESWYRVEEVAVERHFESLALPHTHVAATECKSTMCRIQLTHDDPEAAQQDVHGLAGHGPFKAAHFFRISEDGTQTAIFLARRGVVLPRQSRGDQPQETE